MRWCTTNRGHIICQTDGEEDWFYNDGTLFTKDERPCTLCGIKVGFDDPDPCLGYLPGVTGACCGHGDTEYEYVFTDEKVRYDSIESWRLDTQRGTINPRQNQQEV